MKRFSLILLALTFIAVHAAIAQEQTPPPDAAAPAAQEQEVPAITTVSVDGMEYSMMEYTLQFGDQPLHWVLDLDAEAQGMLIAFTTEDKRDAAYDIQPLADEDAARDDPEDPFPSLYDGANFQGRSWVVRQEIHHLGPFNDKTSSAHAPGSRGVVLYENPGPQGGWGCTFTVPGFSGVVNFGRYSLCNRGNWDNKASAAKLW